MAIITHVAVDEALWWYVDAAVTRMLMTQRYCWTIPTRVSTGPYSRNNTTISCGQHNMLFSCSLDGRVMFHSTDFRFATLFEVVYTPLLLGTPLHRIITDPDEGTILSTTILDDYPNNV